MAETKKEIAEKGSPKAPRIRTVSYGVPFLPKTLTKNEHSFSVMADTPGLGLHHHRQSTQHGLGTTLTLITLFKAMVGAGILSLSAAFYNCGLWIGLVLVPFFLIVNMHGMHILIDYAHVFCIALERKRLDYADVAELAFRFGPACVQYRGTMFRRVVNGAIFGAQLGFCCTYVVFVATNVRQVVEQYSPHDPLSIYMYIAITFPFFLGVCYIRELRYLSFTSFFANGLFIVGLLLIIQYIVRDTIPVNEFPAAGTVKDFGLSLGTIMFTFEAVSLILSIENRMYQPSAMVGWNGVLNTVGGLVCALYCAIGFFGYLKFGPDVAAPDKGTITLNLPEDEILYQVTKLMFSVAIFLTYPLQMFVCIDVIKSHIDKTYHDYPKRALLLEYFSRTCLVVFTFAMAEVIPHIGLFVSLVGAVTCTTLALMFPAMIDIAVLSSELIDVRQNQVPLLKNWRFYKDIALLVLAVVVGVSGTYSSIDAIVKTF